MITLLWLNDCTICMYVSGVFHGNYSKSIISMLLRMILYWLFINMTVRYARQLRLYNQIVVL